MNQIIVTIIMTCIVTLAAPSAVNAVCKNKTHSTASRNGKNNYSCARMSMEYYKSNSRMKKYLNAFYADGKCTLCGCASANHTAKRNHRK